MQVSYTVNVGDIIVVYTTIMLLTAILTTIIVVKKILYTAVVFSSDLFKCIGKGKQQNCAVSKLHLTLFISLLTVLNNQCC